MKTIILMISLAFISLNTFASELNCEEKAIRYIQTVADLAMNDAFITSAEKNEEESTPFHTVYDVAGSASDGWYSLYYKVKFQGDCGNMEKIEFIEGHF